MEIVQTVEHDEAMLAAALLHDVVEDTPVTIEEIQEIFGADVASLVDDLTDVSKPEDGNRKFRKALDREHSAQSSARAQTVKLADLISNGVDIGIAVYENAHHGFDILGLPAKEKKDLQRLIATLE